MREPHPENFAPNYKKPPQKNLEDIDMSGVVAIKPKPSASTPQTERFSERKSERTEIRSEKRTPQFPSRRLSRRYSFEFFDDQITSLKQLKHEAEMRGEKTSLSDMVRLALDEYLEKLKGE